MTRAAWAMMLTTWAVVGFLTFRFFIKALRTPLHPDDDDESSSE